MKKMIRLKIKPNFAVLSREYGCNYRTAKIKYLEELSKEKEQNQQLKLENIFMKTNLINNTNYDTIISQQ